MNTVFKVNDRIVVEAEDNANNSRMATLVAYVQPGNTIYHYDGYFTAGDEGGWIITAEDLVRKTNFRGEIISDFALVKPSEIRLMGAEDFASLPKSKPANRYMAAA